MSDFAVKQPNNTQYTSSTDGSSSVGNRATQIFNGNGVYNSSNTTSSQKTSAPKRTQADIDKAILNIIKNYDITLEDAKNLINQKSKFDTETLENADTNKFNKILICLSNALKDSVIDGKIDSKKLQRVFAGYKYLTMYKNPQITDLNEARKKIQEHEKMSLVDFIKNKSPELRDKPKEQITASDLKDAIKKELKNNLTPEKIQKMKSAPAEAKSFFSNVYSYALDNCTEEEKDMLFQAFVMLIQDNEMSDLVPMLSAQMCEEWKNNPEKLNKFVNEVLPKTLSELGFSEDSIAKIVALTEKGISPETLINLINGAVDFLKNVNPDDVPKLLDILEKQQNKDLNFTDEEKELLKKYQNQINTIVGIYANAVGDKELPEFVKAGLDKLTKTMQESGFDKVVFNQLEVLYKQNPDIFDNLSEDDFAKIINKITDNKYSEAIGDTNPEHLYEGESKNGSVSNDFGLPQRSIEKVNAANEQLNFLLEALGITPTNNEERTNFIKSAKQAGPIDVKKKYQNVKSLTAKDIYEGLSGNHIKIYDVLDNYKDLTQSAKDFVNCLIEKMPASVQNYLLDGIGGHEVLDIVRHINIPPKVLENIKLDYNSRKELEGMQDEKISFD